MGCNTIMMNGMGMMGMMVWGVFSFLLGLLLIFLFVVVVVAAVKWLWGQQTPFSIGTKESALDILKKRYARDEIGKEEFERLKKDIE
ncbi:MAG TPA: SHOCT domain-containing protein [Nitrososphaera sp.]|nr:SHOCT domain-containing protein [Nitrososphaera sp.]